MDKALELIESIILSAEDERTNRSWASDDVGWENVDRIWTDAQELKELLKEQAGTGCWEWIEDDKYRCSECNNTTYVDECMEEPQYLFCPYCGHKMTWAGR